MKQVFFFWAVLMSVFANAQDSGLSLHLGGGFDKLTVRDANMKKFGGGGAYQFNNKFSVVLDASYGLDKDGKDGRTRSFALSTMGYYSIFNNNKHRFNVGAGVVYRNICDLYVTEFTQLGDGTKTDVKTKNDIFNVVGGSAGIAYEYQLCNRMFLGAQTNYQYFTQDIQAYAFGLKLGYRL